jgi:hypothetical protein
MLLNVRVAAFFLCSWIAFAAFSQDEQQLSRLLSQPGRPTVADVKTLLETLPALQEPKFGNTSSNKDHSLEQRIYSEGARVIAQLEYLFPGATIAPLGRDAAILGDIVDAFYQSIGQQGRVQRLNASTSSFKNDPNGTLALEFLKSNGLNLDRDYQGPPFIIFDRTSYSANSQTTQLINAGYRAYAAEHGEVESLLRRFNLVSSHDGNQSKMMPLTNKASIDNYFKAVETHVRQTKSSPSHVIGLGTTLVDSPAWHDTFGAFYNEGNRIVTRPGTLANEQIRRSVLAEMHLAIKIVSSPEFLERVKAQARELGFEFPMHRIFDPLDLKPFEINIEELSKEFFELVGSFPEEGNAYILKKDKSLPRFTPNGKRMSGWIHQHLYNIEDNAKAAELYELFFYGVFRAREANRISPRDAKYLVAELLGTLRLTEEFVDTFRAIFKNKPELQELWIKKREYFEDSDPQRKGGTSVPNNYRLLSLALYQDLFKMIEDLQKKLDTLQPGEGRQLLSMKDSTPIEGEGKAPGCSFTFNGPGAGGGGPGVGAQP